MTALPAFARRQPLRWSAPLGLALLLVACLAAPDAHPQDAPPFVEKRATSADLAAIRQGGYVLYMRHGNTDNSRPDRVPAVDLDDCSTQRPLTPEGRALAAQVGRWLREAAIPIGEIFSSPLCRAKESAQAAFGEVPIVLDKDLQYTANLTSAEKQPILARTRALLSAPVAAGSNRVVVAHAPNLADLIGYFVKPEATVVILAPGAETGFRYIASIHPDMWPQLLQK